MVYSGVHNVLQNATPNELRGKRSSSETHELQMHAYGSGALSLWAITLDVTCTCLTGGRLHNAAFEEGLGVRQVRVALKVHAAKGATGAPNIIVSSMVLEGSFLQVVNDIGFENDQN